MWFDKRVLLTGNPLKTGWFPLSFLLKKGAPNFETDPNLLGTRSTLALALFYHLLHLRCHHLDLLLQVLSETNRQTGRPSHVEVLCGLLASPGFLVG